MPARGFAGFLVSAVLLTASIGAGQPRGPAPVHHFGSCPGNSTPKLVGSFLYEVPGTASGSGVCSSIDHKVPTLTPGHLYGIDATGQIGSNVIFSGKNGPIGWDPSSGLAGNGYPLPGKRRYGLIYREGTEGVGGWESWADLVSFVARVATPLCFKVNDDNPDDNDGTFVITVSDFIEECGPAVPGGTPGGTPVGVGSSCVALGGPCSDSTRCCGTGSMCDKGACADSKGCVPNRQCTTDLSRVTGCPPMLSTTGREQCGSPAPFCTPHPDVDFCQGGCSGSVCGACGACTVQTDCAPNMYCATVASDGTRACKLHQGCAVPDCWVPSQKGTLVNCSPPVFEEWCGDRTVSPALNEQCDPPGSAGPGGVCGDDCKWKPGGSGSSTSGGAVPSFAPGREAPGAGGCASCATTSRGTHDFNALLCSAATCFAWAARRRIARR